MDSLPTEVLTMILSDCRKMLRNTGDIHGNEFLQVYGSVCTYWHAAVVRILSPLLSTFVTLCLINNQKGKPRQTRIQNWIQRHCPLMMGPLVRNIDNLRSDDLLITFNKTGFYLPSSRCRRPLVQDYTFPLTQLNLSGLSAVLTKARATFSTREVKVDIVVRNASTHADHVRKEMIPLIIYLRNYHCLVMDIDLHSSPHTSCMSDCVALWDNNDIAPFKVLWTGIINEYVRTTYNRSVHDGEIAFRAAKTVFDLMENQHSTIPRMNEAGYQYGMLHYIRIRAWNRNSAQLVHEGIAYAAFMRRIRSLRKSAGNMIAFVSSSNVERYDVLYEFGINLPNYMQPSDIASGLQIAAHAFSSAFAERDENAAATLTITTATELFQVQRDMGVSVSFPTYDLKAITINGVPNFPSDFQYVEWLKRIPNGGNLMVDYSRHLAIPVPLLASGRNDTRYDVGAFFDHWNNL